MSIFVAAYRHALQKADVKMIFVPFDVDAFNAAPGERYGSHPALLIGSDEVGQSFADLSGASRIGIRKVKRCRMMFGVIGKLLGVGGISKVILESLEDVGFGLGKVGWLWIHGLGRGLLRGHDLVKRLKWLQTLRICAVVLWYMGKGRALFQYVVQMAYLHNVQITCAFKFLFRAVDTSDHYYQPVHTLLYLQLTTTLQHYKLSTRARNRLCTRR